MKVRSLLAAALAALLVVPAAAAAQAKRTPAKPATRTQAPPARSGMQALSVGGFVGYEMGDLDGLTLRLDAEMPIQKLNPQLSLSGVGSISYSRLTDSAFGLDVTANILKVVPTARINFPLNPQLSVFGDAGVGLYYASVSADSPFGGSVSDSTIGLMLRLGAGGFFQVNERMKVGAELQLDPMISGDYDDTTIAILVGLMYQL